MRLGSCWVSTGPSCSTCVWLIHMARHLHQGCVWKEGDARQGIVWDRAFPYVWAHAAALPPPPAAEAAAAQQQVRADHGVVLVNTR
jgi:hypothetical protein